jgi:3-dehydroshikimate dehydratase
MRRSIATVSLSGTLEEKLAVAAQVGFDGVEIFEADLITCASSPAQVRERAQDLGLQLELYQPFRDFEAVPPELLARNLRRAELKFRLMGELGIDTILVCSSVSPSAVDDDGLAVEQLSQLADLAADHGIRVAYEALGWGRYVNDYAHSWKIVAAADHPNLGLCLDSFHILSRGDDPTGIRDIPGDKIFFLQLADAPDMRMDILQWSRHYRCFPGQGGFDLSGFLRHVLAAGYAGPLSLEVFNDIFRQADAERTAVDALRSLMTLEESLQANAKARVPAPANLTGFAFVEIAVDPLAELATEHLLRALGFSRLARHRSKPVQMWKQGEARVLLNRSRPTPDDWSRGEAGVSAIAVETDDPAQAARRAEALLAPAIPRRYGPGEADLSAVSAPDGTSVFFCRTEAAGWLGDFYPVADGDGEVAGVVTHVDHVGLSQPPYYFDEAALFYQSVLGLQRTDSVEIPDPYGLVRSRAVTSADGRVRLVLNVPALGGGKLPETANFQHIAFACPDIFAAAVDMRVRRLPTLPIPDNYYDDLVARLDLDPSLVETMRAYGVLYDRDEDGEFFHFYTAMLGRRMFFEVVQRVGDYDGFGFPNTPMRMAAQFRHSALAGIMW